MADITGKLKIMMPLVDALTARPHLRELLLNHALSAAYKAGQTVLVRRGTKLKEVSEQRMLAERKVLEDGNISNPDRVVRA